MSLEISSNISSKNEDTKKSPGPVTLVGIADAAIKREIITKTIPDTEIIGPRFFIVKIHRRPTLML